MKTILRGLLPWQVSLDLFGKKKRGSRISTQFGFQDLNYVYSSGHEPGRKWKILRPQEDQTSQLRNFMRWEGYFYVYPILQHIYSFT